MLPGSEVSSSLKIVPAAVAVVIVPPVALDRVTVNASSDSTAVSPLTLTVITWLVSPAAKLTVPLGRTPPAKSMVLAELAPLPVTANCTLLAPVVEPLRVTVNVKAVLPALPSSLRGVGRGNCQGGRARAVVVLDRAGGGGRGDRRRPWGWRGHGKTLVWARPPYRR